MAEDTTTEQHLRADQLFALVWAIKDRPPPAEGEGADPELARALRGLSDAYEAPLPLEHRLGPETVERLLAHTRECKDCRMQLLEDGPGCKRPRTEADIQAEAREKEAQREKKVRRFWLVAPAGVVTFVGSQIVFTVWRQRQYEKYDKTPEGTVKSAYRPEKQIDPVLFAGIGLVILAAFLIADAYVIARELWIDYTRWKRAVPFIGKRWAEGEKKKG